jgi:hypothetical protein
MRVAPLNYVDDCRVAVFPLADAADTLSRGADYLHDVTIEIDGD